MFPEGIREGLGSQPACEVDFERGVTPERVPAAAHMTARTDRIR